MDKLALRVYTQKTVCPKAFFTKERKDPPLRHSRVLVFDTETTIDAYQNLKIGYFRVYHDGYIQHEGLFHDPSLLTTEEMATLKSYATENYIGLYSLPEFIDDVFYPEVYELHTLCIGYNLAFDVSRIAKKAAKSRKRNKGGFSFILSSDRFKPRIIVKQLGTAYTFKFSSLRKKSDTPHFPGHFLDVQRLAEIFLQSRHIPLAKAAEKLATKTRKMTVDEHGTVTENYIDYLITDVVTTFEVYTRLCAELDLYQIQAPLTKIYSSASLAKFALKQLGIGQPPLSGDSNTVGHIMTAYYGGRTECRVRKKPHLVTVLDFTSMYPSVTMLLKLWPFIVARWIDTKVVTEEVRDLLAHVDLAFLQDPSNWGGLTVMVKIKPAGDILPVRMDYNGSGESFNVGINPLSSDTPMWYALPDVIASCILTKKAPEVIEAIRFTPKGVQPNLTKSEILGIPVDPRKDNLIQLLVEERQKIKQRMKGMDRNDPEHGLLESRAQAMKILVNAMSYGIFIELNPEDRKTALDVYGLGRFSTEANLFERPGLFFNPFLAVMITSASRLLLAMAEAWLQAREVPHAYMDTDSVFAPVDYANELSAFFQPLNPYGIDIPILKIETGKVNVWFYGISSKRYALYYYEGGEIELIDYKLHGLGHLLNPYPRGSEHWHAEIWRDLLCLHYGKISRGSIMEKYRDLYALSRLTVSTSQVWNRFSNLNKRKRWNVTIKPFNFVIVGFQTINNEGKVVKPLSAYSGYPQTVVHQPFIDYNTGKTMSGLHCFKSLSTTILQYFSHPEYKYKGDIGYLARRPVDAQGVIYIGKEANKIDEQPLSVLEPQIFRDKDATMQQILAMSTAEAEMRGVGREAFRQIKRRITESGDINLNTPAVKRLID
ncbi:DNA polymerase [Methanoculleus sediminis]|uniref:DNA-directed DNA polymerase n=1 Tax=Methanoculleus sediminis TaxID=1550566 RepID=A0A0H1QX96_9EURY|nr:DNA polymerase [Methanoculleus sediminis]KLK87256.1 DNA polymerase [Methanoculleus sediminis]